MNHDEALHEILEKYVRGLLSPEEAGALERQLAKDPDLREQLRLHRLELESHEYLLRENLRQNVRKWIQEPLAEPLSEPPPSNRIKWLVSLLVIAFVAVIGIWFVGPCTENAPTPPVPQGNTQESVPPTPKQEKPVADNETPAAPIPEKTAPAPKRQYVAILKSRYNDPVNIRETIVKSAGKTTADTTPMGLGIRAYQAGKFQDAILEFDKITPQNNPAQYDLSREWLGHAWLHNALKTKNFDNAVRVFQAIADQKTGDLAQDRAEWYLALSLLADYPKNKQKVDGLLGAMAAQPYHSYRKDAQQLRADLAKNR